MDWFLNKLGCPFCYLLSTEILFAFRISTLSCQFFVWNSWWRQLDNHWHSTHAMYWNEGNSVKWNRIPTQESNQIRLLNSVHLPMKQFLKSRDNSWQKDHEEKAKYISDMKEGPILYLCPKILIKNSIRFFLN